MPNKLVSIHYRLVSLRWMTLLLLIPFHISINTNAQTISLDQCLATAQEHNRSLALAMQDIELSTEKRKEVQGNLLPKISASADYRYYTDLPYQLMPASVFGGPEGTYKEVQFGVPQSLAANLQLQWPVFNPAILGAMHTSRIASEISELQRVRTKEELVVDVSQAYYNAQILKSQIIFLDSNVINMEKLMKTTALLYEQQVVKATDVDRIQLQLDQLISNRTTLQAQYRQVTNVLEFLMGIPFTNKLEVEQVIPLQMANEYQPVQTTELKLMEKKLQLTQSQLQGAKLNRLPSLSAYAMYGTTGMGTTGDNSFFNFYPIGSVGVKLSVPLFSGTVTQHKINQQKIELNKSTLQQEIAIDKNRMEIENARKQYRAAKDFAITTLSQIKLANNIYSQTVLQNQLGVASLTDVLIANNSIRDAQQQYSSALINLFRAELEIKRVTGNLTNSY